MTEEVLSRRFESYGEGVPNLDPTDLTGWLIVVEGTDGVGRTTHIDHLREVLEREGYAVAETGLTRSDLAAEGIKLAKEGNTLGSNAYNLFYATDFADRLERQILPALRAGFVMLTDRYTYSLIARALKPDAVYYLRIQVNDLVPRIIMNGGFDYWESGMDLPMGQDLFDSFVNYQTRVIEELDALAREYAFEALDATRPVEETAHDLSERVLELLRKRAHTDEAGSTGG